jgi:branched-chain amino acid transport system permease protein
LVLPVDRYQVQVFVLSAFVAGGVYAVSHGFASLQQVYWTTSGKVVVTAGIDVTNLVTGVIFVVTVLLFRRGIWGTMRHLVRSRSTKGNEHAEAREGEPESRPAPARQA